MAYSKKGVGSMLSSYGNLEELPIGLSAIYLIAGAFAYGGLGTITLNWFTSYTLTPEHAVWLGIAALAIAFMSSETRRFQDYEPLEQAFIVGGPLLMAADHYIVELNDFLISVGDPLGHQLAFAVGVVGWAVAIR